MIKLSRLDGSLVLLNEDYIEFIEEVPDTVVSLQNGHKILVSEKIDDILERIYEFKRNTKSNQRK